MTRQREHQLSRNAHGLCAYCTNPLHPDSSSMCYHHIVKRRTYYRKKAGCKPGYRTGMGRPAITRVPSDVHHYNTVDKLNIAA